MADWNDCTRCGAMMDWRDTGLCSRCRLNSRRQNKREEKFKKRYEEEQDYERWKKEKGYLL